MTIQVYPEPTDSSQTSFGYRLPNTTVYSFNWNDNYALGRGDRGINTYSYNIPKGVYGAYATNTNGTIYVPEVTGGTSSAVAFFPASSAAEAVLVVATDSTQFKIAVNTAWVTSNISLGTTMFQRFTIGGGNVGVTFFTLSTNASGYRIYASTDMNIWTEQTNPGGTINPGLSPLFGSDTNMYPAAYGNGWFAVATGNANQLFVSTNGFTWTTRNAGMAGIISANVNFANGFFFATATGTGVNFFSTSTDTVNWTSRPSLDVRSNGTAFGNGIYVRVGNAGSIITSTDLVNWTTRTSPTGTGVNLRAVSFGGGYFVAGGSSDPQIVSTDGITWTTSRSAAGGYINNYVYNDGVHIAASQGNSNGSLMVIGTSAAGSASGFATFNISQSTGHGITWTGRNYIFGICAQSSGSVSGTIAYSTTLVGKASNTVNGYIALRGATYIS